MDIKYLIKLSYQTEIDMNFNKSMIKAIPTTFEDALIYSNFNLFEKKIEERKNLNSKDIVELKFLDDLLEIITVSKNYDEFQEKITELISKEGFKASFALDLIYEFEPSEITIPFYIEEGLSWLQKQLHHVE